MLELFIIILILITLLIYFIIDYRGPKSILLKQDIVFGMKCLRASELIVQEFDHEGNLWASRGMILYTLKPDRLEFIRTAHVPTGTSPFWLNNFTLFRRLTLRSECTEMTINEVGNICAFSAGKMWISKTYGRNFHRTMILPHFGRKVGRGMMSTGLLKQHDNGYYFGEYFNNPKRENVRIFTYNDADLTWNTRYVFMQGQIRHIHALQRDPYTDKLWICAGDEDNEALIGWSEDEFKNIHIIGHGSQIWRACQLVFTQEAILWGTDTGSEDLAGIYSWDKKEMSLKRIHKTDGAVFFGTRLKNGVCVMSTDREGFPNEGDDITRLLFFNEDKIITTIECGTWKYKKSGFRFNFAKLRLQRNQGNEFLAISVLNQKECSDGDLFLIHELQLPI